MPIVSAVAGQQPPLRVAPLRATPLVLFLPFFRFSLFLSLSHSFPFCRFPFLSSSLNNSVPLGPSHSLCPSVSVSSSPNRPSSSPRITLDFSHRSTVPTSAPLATSLFNALRRFASGILEATFTVREREILWKWPGTGESGSAFWNEAKWTNFCWEASGTRRSPICRLECSDFLLPRGIEKYRSDSM